MFDRPADRVAALLALAAVTLSLLAMIIQRSLRWYDSAFLLLPVSMLLVGAWWLARQSPGSPFRELALPAAVATVMPLIVVGTVEPRLALASFALSAVAAALLGVRLADMLPDEHRLRVTFGTVALAGLGGALVILDPGTGVVRLAGIVGLAAATALPGLLAGVIRYSLASSTGGRESVVPALEVGVLGLTPAISVVTLYGTSLSLTAAVPVIAWILVVLAAHYLAVRPLARSASVATSQRDIVVAAMEAERSRIAADIHDDALQELTLLGWRLDAAGDKEGAATAREVGDRLRAICGDLRLPILDDLGTGPALEWLVERIERLAGGEVRLERGDQIRPPADVELAFFRVAQEALSNAVRHGRPPIVVRYWTSPSGASLSIDDAGGGFDPGRADDAEGGHFGLLNMRQRAEQIGALLDVRRWPSGGTQVALEWRA